ncbi:MAG: sigma-70 family RNA polymerase sigma factor [Spirochaetia bacterium]|jgi:RNA polymerase sigma-70 factor (ECF subfamily)|nr:sigma-70 family RNA polymerase sigma factor [Spirochaetia bacterium]
MDEQRNDEQIVRQILYGDTEAFRVIVGRYQKQIFNMGFRFFRNENDAYDFVQEVFIKAFQKLGSFRGLSPFRFWLLKIAYNTGINSVKAYKSTSPIDDVAIPSAEKSPEEKHLNEELRKLLLDAVNTLPERYRICVDFYFFYGLSYNEISSMTGFPVNTIKSNVFRAKKELRDLLSGTIAEDYYEL